ncbi:hypothetical protein AAH994_14880 [Weeksellaceae bacterium A-14]
MKETNTEIIIVFIFSIIMTSFLIFYAFKRVKKINSLPKEKREIETQKDNERSTNAFLLKDIVETIQSIFIK